MATQAFLDQLKSWAANQQLAKAIHQALYYLESKPDNIQEDLANLHEEYQRLQNSIPQGKVIDGITFQNYGRLAQKFYNIIKSYENVQQTQTGQDSSIHETIKKEPLLVQGKHISGYRISTNSYRRLLQNLLLSVTSIWLPTLIFLGLSVYFSADYYDENWAKVYIFLLIGLSAYACLKLCVHWIQYYPKFDDFFQLQLINSKGKLVKILKEKQPIKERLLPKKGEIWDKLQQTWHLILASSKPNWLIPSSLLNWHLPIAKGLLLFLLPCLLAIGCLLIFQSYLNSIFIENTTHFVNDWIGLKSQLDFIQSYLYLSKMGYTYSAKTVIASSIFMLGLTVIAVIGGFLKSLKNFGKKYKRISKILYYGYVFFVALTAFTYSGTKAHEFAATKNEAVLVQINWFKYELDCLISDAENLVLEQTLIENLVESAEFQEFLKAYEEFEELAKIKEDETRNTLYGINNLMWYKSEKVRFEDYYLPRKVNLKHNINDLGQAAKDYQQSSDPKPPKPPKPPKGSPHPLKQSPTPTSSHSYQFSSENAASIWKNHRENINIEELKKAKKKLAQKQKQWKSKVKQWGQGNKLLSQLLSPYLNEGSILGFKIGTKTITKEVFTNVVEVLFNNPIATAIFRTVYEETIDPKFEIYLKNQVEALVSKKTTNPKNSPSPTIVFKEIIHDLEQERSRISQHYKKEKQNLQVKLNIENTLEKAHRKKVDESVAKIKKEEFIEKYNDFDKRIQRLREDIFKNNTVDFADVKSYVKSSLDKQLSQVKTIDEKISIINKAYNSNFKKILAATNAPKVASIKTPTQKTNYLSNNRILFEALHGGRSASLINKLNSKSNLNKKGYYICSCGLINCPLAR